MGTIQAPFQNEKETLEVDNMMFENRLDRVSIYGQMDITKDKIGLQNLKVVTDILNRMLVELESQDLPDVISVDEPVKVATPFN